MDNGAHSLFGAALAKSKLGRLHRLAPLSLVIGANLPDADIVVSLVGGKDAYLIQHRGITHSLLGIVVEALLLAATMRWFERRRAKTVAPANWSAYLWPAFLGLLSHLLLDGLNNFGIRPWLPFDDTRYFGDLVFIVDPWLWLLFGGVALLAGRRSRLGTATWVALGAAMTWVLYTNARTPDHMKVAWPFAVALLAALRWRGVGALRPARVLVAGALLFATYLGGLEWCARTAVANALEELAVAPDRGPAPRYLMRSPAVADPLHWTLFFETVPWISIRRVGLDGKPDSEAMDYDFDIPNQLEDPLVKRAMALPAADAWRYFARVPTAWTEKAADGSDHVFLSDGRFQYGRGMSWCVVEVDLSKADGKSHAGTAR